MLIKRDLKRFLRVSACLCFTIFAATAAYAAPQASGYKVARRLPVGGDGGWDYLKVDPDARRIYISRGSHMMVIDETSGQIVGDIRVANTTNMHGIALAKNLGKGFTSDGDANTVTVVDLKTLAPVSVIPIEGKNPDSVLYEPGTKRVFTFNGRSANSTVIDATSGKVLGSVTLAGKPEEPVADGKGNIFVNIEDKNMLQEFDAKTLAIKNTWPLSPCEEPSALAFDSTHRRIFAACDNVMVVVNADTGKVVASLPIGGDPDGNGYDPETGILFASCREGFMSIFHQDSADKYTAMGNVSTQFGARTMALDTQTHHVFTVTADFKPAAPPSAENPRSRPQAVPGSFVILELAK